MSESKKEKEGEAASRKKFKSICIFGGSKAGKSGKFVVAASELGRLLAYKKINVVFGGGMNGVRGCAAVTALVHGSKVLGITVKDFVEKDTDHFAVGTELRVTSLPERSGYMLTHADAFIALPGGLETLDEIFSIAFWAKINFHRKPLGLLNVNGFYSGLMYFLDHAVRQEFIPQATRNAIMFASTAEELLNQMERYVPEPNPSLKQIDVQPPESNKQQEPESSKQQEPDTALRL